MSLLLSNTFKCSNWIAPSLLSFFVSYEISYPVNMSVFNRCLKTHSWLVHGHNLVIWLVGCSWEAAVKWPISRSFLFDSIWFHHNDNQGRTEHSNCQVSEDVLCLIDWKRQTKYRRRRDDWDKRAHKAHHFLSSFLHWCCFSIISMYRCRSKINRRERERMQLFEASNEIQAEHREKTINFRHGLARGNWRNYKESYLNAKLSFSKSLHHSSEGECLWRMIRGINHVSFVAMRSMTISD